MIPIARCSSLHAAPPLAAHGDQQSMSHCSQLCKRRCGVTRCQHGWTESRRCKGELLHGARNRPPSCGEEPSLDAVLSVCLRCLVFASEHIWHISSHYASLQSTGAVLGVAHRDGRLFTGMPEANPCISYFFVSQVGWWQETKFRMATVGFSDDGSCCWSRVNVRGRSLFVAVT